MSRYYKVEVTLIPKRKSKLDKMVIESALNTWGMDTEYDWRDLTRNEYSWEGTTTLGSGRSEQEAHNILRELIPDALIQTRWKYIEDSWDEVFKDEGEENEEILGSK